MASEFEDDDADGRNCWRSDDVYEESDIDSDLEASLYAKVFHRNFDLSLARSVGGDEGQSQSDPNETSTVQTGQPESNLKRSFFGACFDDEGIGVSTVTNGKESESEITSNVRGIEPRSKRVKREWEVEKRFETVPRSEWIDSFSVKEIRLHLGGTSDDWRLCDEDRNMALPCRYFSSKRVGMECHRCRQVGHRARQCTVKVKQCCKYCGGAHNARKCYVQDRFCALCLELGHRADVCDKSTATLLRRQCRRCGCRGHLENVCPEHWRQFHSTTTDDGQLRNHGLLSFSEGRPRAMYCYNCGQQGHLGHECRKSHSFDGRIIGSEPSVSVRAPMKNVQFSPQPSPKAEIEDSNERQQRHLKQWYAGMIDSIGRRLLTVGPKKKNKVQREFDLLQGIRSNNADERKRCIGQLTTKRNQLEKKLARAEKRLFDGPEDEKKRRGLHRFIQKDQRALQECVNKLQIAAIWDTDFGRPFYEKPRFAGRENFERLRRSSHELVPADSVAARVKAMKRGASAVKDDAQAPLLPERSQPDIRICEERVLKWRAARIKELERKLPLMGPKKIKKVRREIKLLQSMGSRGAADAQAQQWLNKLTGDKRRLENRLMRFRQQVLQLEEQPNIWTERLLGKRIRRTRTMLQRCANDLDLAMWSVDLPVTANGSLPQANAQLSGNESGHTVGDHSCDGPNRDDAKNVKSLKEKGAPKRLDTLLQCADDSTIAGRVKKRRRDALETATKDAPGAKRVKVQPPVDCEDVEQPVANSQRCVAVANGSVVRQAVDCEDVKPAVVVVNTQRAGSVVIDLTVDCEDVKPVVASSRAARCKEEQCTAANRRQVGSIVMDGAGGAATNQAADREDTQPGISGDQHSCDVVVSDPGVSGTVKYLKKERVFSQW